MKNKGATLIELIVSFVIISFISISMFRTILSLSDKLIYFKNNSDLRVMMGSVSNLMYTDLIGRGFTSIATCGTNCYQITFGDATTKQISINSTTKLITYGTNSFKLTKNINFNGSIYYDLYQDATTSNVFKKIIRIDIPLIDEKTSLTYDINIVYQNKS